MRNKRQICEYPKRKGDINVRIRTILDGNAFYEIDEDCMEKKKQKRAENEMKSDKMKKEQGKHTDFEKRR